MKRNRYIAVSIILAVILVLCAIGFVHSEEYPSLTAQLIGADDSGVVYSDLTLPETVDGIDGTISWTAKNDGLIKITGETGKILEYNVGEKYSTSVTANLENGDSKEIPFSVGYKPDKKDMSEVFSENFDKETFEGTLGKSTNDTSAPSDGKLVMTRSEKNVGSKASSFTYTFPKTYAGVYAVEYEVTAVSGVNELKMGLPLPTNSNQQMAQVTIDANGVVKARGNDGNKTLTTVSSRENVKIKIIFDTGKEVFDVYINDSQTPQIENAGFRFTGGGYVDKLRIWFDKKEAAATVSIDNIKIYAPNEILGDITRKIVNNGSDGSYTNGDLYLPPKTLDKYDVSYSVAEGNIAAYGEYGKISASYTEELNETVKAECVLDDVTYFREMYFKIPVCSLPKPKTDANGKEIINTYEDFSSFDLSTIVTSAAFSDSEFYLEDGKFVIEKTGTDGGDNNVMIPLKTSTSIVGTNLVAEFDLVTEKSDRVVISITNRHANNGRFGNIRVGGANVEMEECDTTLESYAESSNGINTKVYSSFKTGRTFKFVIKMTQTEDKKDARWSMWINGERVAKNLPCRNPNFASNINYLKFSNGGGVTNKLTIDNFKVYEGEDAPVERVEAVFDKIKTVSDIAQTDEETGEVTGNLVIEENEADVEFSDTKGLISEDGSVIFPTHATNDVITISASYDGYSAEKEIVAKIASNYIFGEASLEGMDLKEYLIAEIPTDLRREENENETVKVLLSVYDSEGNLVCEELSDEHQVMADGKNYGLIGYIEQLSEMPENPVVKLSVFSSTDDFKKSITNLTVYGN